MSTTFALINNLKQIKTNIMTSLKNKGVEVPEDSKLENVPGMIDSIESGGGSEDDFILNGVAYMFDYDYNYDNRYIFDDIIKHFPKKIPSLYYTFRTAFTDRWFDNEKFNKILQFDLTECENMQYAFYGAGFDIYGKYDLYIPKCTTLNNTFGFWKTNYTNYENPNGTVSFDFHGTTSNVTNFGSSFSSNNKANLANIGEIININMDKCTYCTSVVSFSNIRRFVFDGSFGGSSTTSSLTLDLCNNNKMTKDSVVETFNSVSQNTNSKTRIFKLSQEIYESLTEEEIAIATDKGYTVSY